jgi:hypothetical protein
MTEPVTDTGRETRLIPIGDRMLVVRQLTDTQMVHLLRHSKILQADGVDRATKMDSVERIFRILHTVVVQQEDKDYLDEQEESGQVELKDLMPFVTAFSAEPEKPKARRGRPPRVQR